MSDYDEDVQINNEEEDQFDGEYSVSEYDEEYSYDSTSDEKEEEVHLDYHSSLDTQDLSSDDSDDMLSTSSTKSSNKSSKNKKKGVDPLYLQRLIDKDLRARISTDAFKQAKVVTMVKNTVGIKCKRCGSDNVNVESKQVRSADEAMTKFYTCLDCGNKWRFD